MNERIHLGQLYRCVGVEPYTRRDGSETELAVWKSHCAQCGAPFAFRAPANRTTRFQPNRRCHKHKRAGVRVKSIRGEAK